MISTAGWDEGGNAGGQRTWIAPEAGPGGFFFRDARWAVPAALDPGDYRPCPATTGWLGFRSSFTARAADGRELPVAITRRMMLEALPGAPDALRIRFQHELANTGATAVESCIGLEHHQLPCEERHPCSFASPGAAGAAAIPRPYFTELPRASCAVRADNAGPRGEGRSKNKVGVRPRFRGCRRVPETRTGAGGGGNLGSHRAEIRR